ncbi:hypothetical protein TPA0908_11980 [Micromonospora sp. AKA38]|nr:hypothetical protein TPA0908_11980 [Micromonospora sp. AKA38]
MTRRYIAPEPIRLPGRYPASPMPPAGDAAGRATHPGGATHPARATHPAGATHPGETNAPGWAMPRARQTPPGWGNAPRAE